MEGDNSSIGLQGQAWPGFGRGPAALLTEIVAVPETAAPSGVF